MTMRSPKCGSGILGGQLKQPQGSATNAQPQGLTTASGGQMMSDDPTATPPRGVTPPERTRKVRPIVKQRMRLAVYERDGYQCVACGWAPLVPAAYDGSICLWGPDGTIRKDTGYPKCRQLELDHIVPFSRGGDFTLDNLQAMCHVCNARKGSKVL